MRILLALTVLALTVSPLWASQADEENAIREIQVRWDDAWNRHDVKALSSLVAEDFRFANVAGVVLTGRGEFGTPRPPRDGVMLQVLMKRDGKWAVVAAQNTNVR